MKPVILFVYRHPFVRYLFVGGTTVVIDFSLLVVLHEKFNVSIPIATSVAYWTSIAYNFSLNRWWTFSQSERKSLKKHLTLYGVLLGCNYIFTVLSVSVLSHLIFYGLAKALTIAIQVTWTYPVYKYYIFGTRKPPVWIAQTWKRAQQTVRAFHKQRPWGLLVGIGLVGLAITYTRKPDAFLHPQFWAEDGKFWFADAYNHGGFRSLFMPYAGSLQLFTRLVGSASLLLPFKLVPSFFLAAAVALQLLPVLLINTKRFVSLVPHWAARLVICFCYLAIPNSFEVHANLTNANWHLALVACMVAIAPLPSTKLWKIFDSVVLILFGLTGPFALVLATLAWIRWYVSSKKERSAYLLYPLILTACALVQLAILALSDPSDRFTQGNAATPSLLLSIVGVRIAGAGLFGMSHINLSSYDALLSPAYWLLALCVGATLLYALWKGPLALKLFILFTWGVFAGALLKPQASELFPQWQALVMGAGNRYFFLPTVSWIVASVWLVSYTVARQQLRKLAYVAALPLVCMVVFAIPKDWVYSPWPDLHFGTYASQVEATPSHQQVCVPINPDWQMCLDKR